MEESDIAYACTFRLSGLNTGFANKAMVDQPKKEIAGPFRSMTVFENTSKKVLVRRCGDTGKNTPADSLRGNAN